MPGITGIIAARPGAMRWKAVVEMMTAAMMHEPFYVSGTYSSDVVPLHVGWTCFQTSSSAILPIWNESRNVALILVGEQYWDKNEIDNLRSRGHDFDPASAQWLVHLYEDEGLRFLQRLNGWFSGVLLDLRSNEVVLFNDRYGLNRIYYHENPNGFYFSSEAKSLLKALPETRGFDYTSLGEFFSIGCPLENRSLFKGISLIPPGSSWITSLDGKLRRHSYFDKRTWEEQERLTPAEYLTNLKQIFPQVLQRYLDGKKIGISLTGGVDSRMIMAWAAGRPGSLPCYTFRSEYRDSVDVTVAREVAKICRQPHRVIEVGNKFLSEFQSLAEQTVYLTDGAMDVSGAAELFVNRIAREISPVRLTGNYGGEILRELVVFKPQVLHQPVFEGELAKSIVRASHTYQRELSERRLSFIAFKQVPWHHFSRLSLERSQVVMRSPFLDNDIVQLAYRTPLSWAQSNDPALRLIAEGNPALGCIGTDRGVLFKPVPVLTKLQHLYQEFTFKAEYAYDYGMPHWLAGVDSLFKPLHLERLFLGRHKFCHFRLWYRSVLASYLKNVLLDRRTLSRPFFRPARVETMVRDHISGKANYTLEIHRVLSFELIQRTLLEEL